MMTTFTNEEYCEMILIFGECNRNGRAAERVYAQRFPNAKHPDRRTITNAVRRLRDTGSVRCLSRSGRPMRDDTDILAYVFANPHCSLREVGEESGLSFQRVQQILKRHNMHPYSCFFQQALHPGDQQKRLDFCNFLLNALEDDPQFVSNILWTDESKFTQDGVVNRHNTHYWSQSNPYWTRDAHHQTRWSTNVWCGLWGNHVVGPFFYQQSLNGERYLNLLNTDVADFIDNLPLQQFNNMWYQQDGAPAHGSAQVTQWLNNLFHQQWIGNRGPVAWPPRSPDLTPLDFFLWGHLKSQVYETPPLNLLHLKQRITAACNSVNVETLENTRRHLIARVQACIVAEGEHFEYCV